MPQSIPGNCQRQEFNTKKSPAITLGFIGTSLIKKIPNNFYSLSRWENYTLIIIFMFNFPRTKLIKRFD